MVTLFSSVEVVTTEAPLVLLLPIDGCGEEGEGLDSFEPATDDAADLSPTINVSTDGVVEVTFTLDDLKFPFDCILLMI